MGRVTFILGGARSGKSSYALEIARASGRRKVAFIATCEALDNEMARRIALHKKSRPASWKTFDEPRRVAALLEKIEGKFEYIVLDCLTLLVSNLFLAGKSGGAIEKEIVRIFSALKKSGADAAIVSNEVGLGIVPERPVARGFRDIAGRVNQLAAKAADEVCLMVAGIPRRIK
ncbi:MAG: bifunctional adenosylcobinamide kinase/adenosylcobinamide-phosphate guanylyltransferase [Candidatus Omnitrophica bacterium]|nr:bifunctional adenosylcobinamide kinase/adenosylcobinamide-phosphate guanylyltransferase [Candidatus Omnitrophota bacterium]MCM8791365.1 bifunctional adenosylcobinamide kinase/adenosylcobinamide-phosphate guanylyltransferase [Candidatus Omnitrophota bacterium]